MRKFSRTRRGRPSVEIFNVELLEDRRLLNGRALLAGPYNVSTSSSNSDSILSAGIRPIVESEGDAENPGANFEVPQNEVDVEDDGGFSTPGNLTSNSTFQATDDDHTEQDHEDSWDQQTHVQPLSGGSNVAIQSQEDERQVSATNQPTSLNSGTSSKPLQSSDRVTDTTQSPIINTKPSATPSQAQASGFSQAQASDQKETPESFENDEIVHPAAAQKLATVQATPTPIGPSVDAKLNRLPVEMPSHDSESVASTTKRETAVSLSTSCEASAEQRAGQQGEASKLGLHAENATWRENLDGSPRVDNGRTEVEASIRTADSSSSSGKSQASQLAAAVDAILATPPQVAELLSNILSVDLAAMELGMKNVLDEVDALGRELTDSLSELNVPSWLLTAAVVTAASEAIRLQRKRAPGVLAIVVDDNGDRRTWLPDSVGSAPPEGLT